MNLQFVNFIFLIGYRLRVLNSELNSTITGNCAYVIDFTWYIDGNHRVSVVVVSMTLLEDRRWPRKWYRLEV